MPRPKKAPGTHAKKENFSGPRDLVLAAKLAAGVDKRGKFSTWLVDAIEEKLNRDHPGLTKKLKAAIAERPDAMLLAEEQGDYSQIKAIVDEVVARAALAPTEAYPTRPAKPKPKKKSS